MERLQQLLRGQHQVTQQAGAALPHVLPYLRGGCGLRSPGPEATQGLCPASVGQRPWGWATDNGRVGVAFWGFVFVFPSLGQEPPILPFHLLLTIFVSGPHGRLLLIQS